MNHKSVTQVALDYLGIYVLRSVGDVLEIPQSTAEFLGLPQEAKPQSLQELFDEVFFITDAIRFTELSASRKKDWSMRARVASTKKTINCRFSTTEDQVLCVIHTREANPLSMHRYLSEIIASLSHALATPLTVLLALLDRETIDRERCRAALAKMQRSIRILRSFASSADPLEWISVRDMLEQTATLCEERLHNHGVVLSIECNAELRCECQPQHIMQALMILISSMHISLRDQKNAHITLSATEHIEDNSMPILRITLSDQGSIIDENMLDSVRNLIESHYADLSSKTDSGRSFIIEMPIKQPSEPCSLS